MPLTARVERAPSERARSASTKGSLVAPASFPLEQVPVDAQGSVEDTEDVDLSRAFDYVGDSVVTVKKDADVPVRLLSVPVA